MPLPDVQLGDVVSVDFLYTFNGQRLINTFAYEVDEPPTDPTSWDDGYDGIVTMVSEVGGLKAALKAVMSNEVQFDAIRVQVVAPFRLVYHKQDLFEFGDVDNPPLPQNVASSLERYGAGAGRRNVGRIQIPGLTINDVEDGKTNVVYRLLVDEVGQEMTLPRTGTVGLGSHIRPVLINRDEDGVIIGTTPVIGYRIQDTVRVMRRRTVGLGI